MTGISTSIELYDRVSAPIYKMLSALDHLTSGFESIETSMNGAFDTDQLASARKLIDGATGDMDGFRQSIAESQQQQEQLNRSIRGGESAMDGLMGKVVGLVGAYAGLQTMTQVVNLSDELVQTKARVDMMNDGLQTTPELMNMIYRAAQNARGSFIDMAAVVAKFGNNAGGAFDSSEEIVAFSNLIQKQMTIAGASTAEASNAMMQLSQALGSGVLRGDELNSIFEQAPNLIQNIAKYIQENETIARQMADAVGVSYEDMSTDAMAHIRTLASEGLISAEIVKNAMFSASDEINSQFESIPMTWGQVWTTMKNGALMQFQPVLQKINDLANNQDFQAFASNAVGALASVASVLLDIMSFAGGVASFFTENWSIIAPILTGIAAALALVNAPLVAQAALWLWNTVLVPAYTAVLTFLKIGYGVLTGSTAAASAAQFVYNNALLACPLTWILLIIIAVIAAVYAIVAAINKLTGTTTSATGVILGTLTAAASVIWNLFLTLLNLIIQGCVVPLTTAWDVFANFFGNIFNDPIATIIRTFEKLANTVLGILQSIANGIDAIFGSNLAGTVQGWMNGISGKADELVERWGNGSYEEKSNVTGKIQSLLNGLQTEYSWDTSDAYKLGYGWGESVDESVSGWFSGFGADDPSGLASDLFNGGGYEYGGYDASQVPSNISEIAGNTGSMADSLDIASEDLKYLRDIAESETVNRFTTAEIKVEMTNHNSISSDMDLDGVVDYLVVSVNEAMEKAAEGVHD